MIFGVKMLAPSLPRDKNLGLAKNRLLAWSYFPAS
jgi:hypothetical protein